MTASWHLWHARCMAQVRTQPVIIEAALNGVTSKERNPLVPITPEEHAKDGLDCVAAGATVIHTHTADMLAPVEDVAAQYADAYRPIVDAHPGVICYATTGVGPTIEDRYRHVELLADTGLTRAAFVDTGSVNLGGTGSDGLPAGRGYVYKNDFADVAHKMRVCAAARTRTEHRSVRTGLPARGARLPERGCAPRRNTREVLLLGRRIPRRR